MPKSYSNLYEQIYDYENLYNAYLEARKSKRYREGVLRFSANLEENLIVLQNHLMWQSYTVGEYRRTIIRIPKTRIIMILPFKDRVLQWAIYRVIYPLFEKSFISDSYGCIEGRGDLAAVRRIQYWLNKLGKDGRDVYALEMDIRKYFFRVPHDVILDTLRKKISDNRVMWLLDTIVNSKTTPFGLPHDVSDVETAEMLWDVGMPVGSLISQMTGNIVLNELDQFIKRKLRVKHYIRYMDNFNIFGHSKPELRDLKAQIELFLHHQLRLDFSKAEISNTKHGIEFAGFRVWSDKLHIRKSTTLRMKRRLAHVKRLYSEGKIPLEKARAVFNSYYRGLLAHCDNDSLREKVLEDWVLARHSK